MLLAIYYDWAWYIDYRYQISAQKSNIFCNIIIECVGFNIVIWHRNAWAYLSASIITALHIILGICTIYQQKSTLVIVGQAYWCLFARYIVPLLFVRKQFNLETYFSFFLFNRKQINLVKKYGKKIVFKHQTYTNMLKSNNVILNKEKIRFSSALLGIIKSSTEHYTMTTWPRGTQDWVKKKTVPLVISFAFATFLNT